MIEYVIPHNPDDRILKKASSILDSGDLICFPTDTNWIIAGSINSKEGIEKLYKIKKEGKQKHYSILCYDIAMASEMALIDNQAFKNLKKMIPGNYTFIFEATKKIAKNVQASKTDKEVGIRFVPRELVKRIIQVHGAPLISTNIPSSILDETTNEEPLYSYQIEDLLMGIIKLIIDPGEFSFDGPSTIIDFSQGTGPMLVREGVGEAQILS